MLIMRTSRLDKTVIIAIDSVKIIDVIMAHRRARCQRARTKNMDLAKTGGPIFTDFMY